jgi:hypothetical protein
MAAKNYMTTGSGFNYGNEWLPEADDPIAAQILAALPADDAENYQLLYNPDMVTTGNLTFFHFYAMN